MAHTPTSVSEYYFSARLLLRHASTAPALVELLRTQFKLEVGLSAVSGWLQRDQIPGPVVAHMLVSSTPDVVSSLVARRVQPHTATEAALLS